MARKQISTSATMSEFTHSPLRQANNLTSGRIYESIINARAPRRLSGKDLCR
jgi:hypothetical protein